MSDLFVAVGLMCFASIAALWWGRRLGRAGARTQAVVGLAVLIVFVAYLTLVRDAGWVTRWLPGSAVAIYSNPVPALAGLVAGVLSVQATVPAWRRAVLAAVLLGFGWEGPVGLLFARAPNTHALWSDGVCIQSTPATCTPAAAATLLRHHGIAADESEMARRCRTNARGTHLLGLYRGLVLKTDDTAWTPRVESPDFETFRRQPDRLPAVVSVRLTRSAQQREPRYARQWGWTLGVTHSVVVFGFTEDGFVEIGDPGAGRERWSTQGLSDLWADEVAWLSKDAG